MGLEVFDPDRGPLKGSTWSHSGPSDGPDQRDPLGVQYLVRAVISRSEGGPAGVPTMVYTVGKERCESGRIGLTANELTWETGSEGSNPSLSALQ